MRSALLTLLAAALVAGSRPDTDAEKKLEAAIHQEMVVGDLPGAIAQYKAILVQNGTNKAVAARALFQMGQCQEKLGERTAARSTYARVAKEYADQMEIAAQVRPKLAAWTDTQPGPRNLGFEQGEPGSVPSGWFVPTPGWAAELHRDGCRSGRGCTVVQTPATAAANRYRFGNLMQTFSAAAYRGKTVRLRAWLRLEGVDPADSAQMWLRVDRPNRQVGFFDNMQDRPVRSSQWTSCEIVGQIADDAENINVGLMSIGKGRAWIDDVSFEIVPNGQFKETGSHMTLAQAPQNLAFAQGEPGKVPSGWFVPTSGWAAELHRDGCRSNRGCTVVQSPADRKDRYEFGNLMQTFSAAAYRGKTVRLQAWVRLEATDSEDRAQMWLRVDRSDRQMGFFDNMQNRPVVSSGWTSCEIVGPIAEDAEYINIGLMSIGKGRAWIDDVTFEVVAAPLLKLDSLKQADRASTAPIASRGADFGVATASFPVKDAVGKRVRFSGYIKTEGIKNGYAGLWWRVDGMLGADGRRKTLAFDNMQNRGLTGTLDWKRYEINLFVPADATNINFGALHPGDGTAWFDGLTIELDGVPYLDTSKFDLGFGSMPVRGFYTGGNGYNVRLDSEVVYSGKQSLRMQYLGDGRSSTELPGHGYAGISYSPVTADEAKAMGLRNAAGAMVRSLTPNGAAEKAGIKPGDVVLRLNSKLIVQSRDLVEQLATMKPGDRAVLTVFRNGREQNIPVILEGLPASWR